jgi:hypothetical protein
MLEECLDGEWREKVQWTPKLTWNYEVGLALGNYSPSLEIPGQILRVLEGKPWAPERTDLLPRALGMTNFPNTAASPFQGLSISGRISIKDRVRPIWNPKDRFDRFWGTWSRRTSFAFSQAPFCVRGEVPVRSKNRKISRNIFAFILSIFYYAERVLGCFFPAENPNFLEFTQGSRKEWNLGKSIRSQISPILGIWQLYIYIWGVE